MKRIVTLINTLREKGYKITPQRRVIIEQLVTDKSHPTVEEIYQRVRSVMPEVSRTTIYNTVRELVALGELTEMANLSEGGARYDTDSTPHHHLVCVRCHTLVDIYHDFDGVTLSPEETAGYRVMTNQITFYGICPHCQSTTQAEQPM
jgi:Fe2+ or Zn2+ uptake regulation protein